MEDRLLYGRQAPFPLDRLLLWLAGSYFCRQAPIFASQDCAGYESKGWCTGGVAGGEKWNADRGKPKNEVFDSAPWHQWGGEFGTGKNCS